MHPSPFVLENPNVLLVSELDWPPERGGRMGRKAQTG